MDPVPVAPIASARADVTIAVDLGGERNESQWGAPVRETAEERPIEEWADRLRRRTANLLDRDLVRSLLSHFGGAEGDEKHTAKEQSEALPGGLGRFDVMNQSLEAMQSVLTRYRLAGNPPDVLITIPKDACRGLDFHRASDMIAVGREQTVAALDRSDLTAGIQRSIYGRRRSRRVARCHHADQLPDHDE